MNQAIQSIFAFSSLIALSACGEKTIDASTEEKAKSSIESISKDMSESQLKEFTASLLTIYMSNLGDEPKANAMINGKTASEINALAKEISIAQEQQRKEAEARRKAEEIKIHQEKIKDIQLKLAEIAKREKENESMRQEMQSIIIADAQYKQGKHTFDNSISFTIKNSSSHVLSEIFFTANLTSPGRKVAWAEEKIRYSIKGGLNPGETIELNLYPPSEFANLPKRNDYVLAIQIEGADDEAGNSIWKIHKALEEEKSILEKELSRLTR